MLRIKPTEHLAGVTIQGDYNDFYELVHSIYRITGHDEDKNDVLWCFASVKSNIEYLWWEGKRKEKGSVKKSLIYRDFFTLPKYWINSI